MFIQTVPHINLRGQARQALAFYQSVFGGEITMVTYAQAGNAADPADAEHIMWGQVTAPSGFRVMAYDVQAGKAFDQGENAYYISVRGDDAAGITDQWNRLRQGASILQELGPAQWTPLYGMLKDQFGVTWILDVEVRPAA